MKRLIVLATGLLAALAVTVAPASAGQAPAANSGVCSGWEAAGAAAFDSLGALTATGSSARTAGNVPKEPSLSATYEALPDSAKGKARAGIPRERARLDPRDQRRRHGQHPAERHRQADVGHQPRLRRLLRRRRLRLLVHARGRHAHQ